MAKRGKTWPIAARPNYIRLFSLTERLRVHLKVAQELAHAKRLISYRKQLCEADGVLRNIYDLITQIQVETGEIKAIYGIRETAGRPPKWFEISRDIHGLTDSIKGKMLLIEQDLKYHLDVAVIKKTDEACISAYSIREKLLSLPLDESKIELDKHGLEVIVDQSEAHILDLKLWQLNTIRIIK